MSTSLTEATEAVATTVDPSTDSVNLVDPNAPPMPTTDAEAEAFIVKPKRVRKPKVAAEAPAVEAAVEPAVEAVAALAEAPIADAPTPVIVAVVETEPAAEAAVIAPFPGALVMDPETTKEAHRVITVMTRYVKSACTLMFVPGATASEDEAPLCSDCSIMWNKAIGTGDPEDASVVAAAIATLKAGTISIPSCSDGMEIADEFKTRPATQPAAPAAAPARASAPAFDAMAVLRTIVFADGEVLSSHVKRVQAMLAAGEFVLKGTAAARPAREPREPRQPSSRPATTAPRGGTRSVQPVAQIGPDGKQLRKMWQVEAFGPFLIGENQNEWLIRDTRTNTDETGLGRKAEGQAAAKAKAAAAADALPQADRESLEAAAKLRMVWDETRFVAR